MKIHRFFVWALAAALSFASPIVLAAPAKAAAKKAAKTAMAPPDKPAAKPKAAAKPAAKPKAKKKSAAKGPSVHVNKDSKRKRTPEMIDAAEMKPIVHVDVEVGPEATRHTTIKALIELAYDVLEDAHIGTADIGGRHAVLALWNPANPRAGLDIVNVLEGRSRTEDVMIDVLLAQGVGSKYRITPEGREVLALRTNVTAKSWKTFSKRKVKHYLRNKKGKRTGKWRWETEKVSTTHYTTEPVTYVPFSPLLDSFEMRADGKHYLENLVKVGHWVALHRGIMSKPYPHLNVTQVIPDHVAMALLINEHGDHDEFAKYGGVHITNKVFTNTGLNGKTTYNYSGSFAGAYGFAQFIQSSYEETVRNCPKAKLIKEFRAGMRDHVNAVLAQYCYMDEKLGLLPENVRARLLRPENAEELGAFLAASYNCSPARAVKTYLTAGKNWETYGYGLPLETTIYLQKYHAIYKYQQELQRLNP